MKEGFQIERNGLSKFVKCISVYAHKISQPVAREKMIMKHLQSCMRSGLQKVQIKHQQNIECQFVSELNTQLFISKMNLKYLFVHRSIV